MSEHVTFRDQAPASDSAVPAPLAGEPGQKRLKVLLIAPFFDKTVAGESWSTFKWVEGISELHDVTVLTTHKRSWNPAESPTKATRIVNWTDPKLPAAFARLNRELKPTYFLFYRRARKWIKAALKRGEQFDLVHQINPLALRYPCPARGLGLKYIMGPLAGSLSNPEGFRDEAKDKQWYRKLRNLDAWRIRSDPWLRESYAGASLILGVAPYVEEILRPAGIKRFEVASETGVETVTATPKSAPAPDDPLRLLYVGRIIRTKGVIDAIRAVALARKSANITFDIVGTGDMDDACKAEATRLGVNDIVTFHGRVPRSEVDGWYARSHVFLFPSFREPSGNVVFEALGFGLPVIGCNRGGPGYVVNNSCGIKVEAAAPTEFSESLSEAIISIYSKRNNIPEISSAGLQRISSLALWSRKHTTLLASYYSVTSDSTTQRARG